MIRSPFAGQLPTDADLVDVKVLLQAFERDQPDPNISSQRVSFGTSGHRGSSLDRTFNRNHILAMSQAICFYRREFRITGPLYLGFDTHALSKPAFEAALEVFAANEIQIRIDKDLGFTPTPVISHAILAHNRDLKTECADGVVITPSHNPPQDGGFKYNPTHGGPAEKEITDWIQIRANQILEQGLAAVQRVDFETALQSSTTTRHDYIQNYVQDLDQMIDFDLIRNSNLRLAVDPLGGAGVLYWQHIADHYRINLTVLNKKVDPTFRFMTRDWDGKIRMDPSSKDAMKSVLDQAPNFDLLVACDTDHDRHGIVTKSAGLMPPNHYLVAMIWYLFQNRPQWSDSMKVGKTLVSSQMIDRVAQFLDRQIFEVPVGFKWFVEGLLHSQLGFVGEESAGASFLRRNGKVWTTDKDGFVPALLAAEMTAKCGRDPGQIYADLAKSLGQSFYGRVDAPATEAQKSKITSMTAETLPIQTLGGDAISRIMTKAPGNQASIGGIKIETTNGWIAARPSGTEDILKVYAESFVGPEHLQKLFDEAAQIVHGTDVTKLATHSSNEVSK